MRYLRYSVSGYSGGVGRFGRWWFVGHGEAARVEAVATTAAVVVDDELRALGRVRLLRVRGQVRALRDGRPIGGHGRHGRTESSGDAALRAAHS